MGQTIGIAILAAGRGERLNLNVPKPLVPLCGKKLVDFPVSESLAFAREASLEAFSVAITGHFREEVERHLEEKYSGQLTFAFQPEQRGTADALRSYFESHAETREMDFTLVICGDTPLIRRKELSSLYQALQEENLLAVAATFCVPNPHGYGRIIEGDHGFHIIEEKDADDETKKVSQVNSGLYLCKTSFLLQHVYEVQLNRNNEFYLTDIFQDWPKTKAVLFENSTSFLGVNSSEQLCDAEHYIRREINKKHQESGVHIVDHRHTYIDWGVTIGAGSIIHPHNFIYGETQLGASVILEPCCSIRDMEIYDHAQIKSFSYLEESIIQEEASVGPFARIRPGSNIGPQAKVGNFVETKKAKLERGVKVGHLSYIGDAEIGEETNIGCGFITCNYDGTKKHKTTIGKNSFVGSDTQAVAPVSIGDHTYIGSGSTINRDVPDGAFAVARARQVNKGGMAERFKK